MATGQPFQPSDTGGGIFGISPLFSQNVSTDYQLGRLRSQIYVLVQASLKSEDQALIATLATGVKEFLPERANLDVWLAILDLAQPVAEAAPWLAVFFMEELEKRWPIELPPALWETEILQHERTLLRDLAESIERLAQQVSRVNPAAAARMIMQKAWLVAAVLTPDPDETDPIGIGSIIGAGGVHVGGQLERVLRQRSEALQSVIHWLEEPHPSLPVCLVPRETSDTVDYFFVLTFYAGIKPFLTLTIESAVMGTAESEDTLVLSHHELPADGVSGETLMAATAAVARLISKLGTTRGP